MKNLPISISNSEVKQLIVNIRQAFSKCYGYKVKATEYDLYKDPMNYVKSDSKFLITTKEDVYTDYRHTKKYIDAIARNKETQILDSVIGVLICNYLIGKKDLSVTKDGCSVLIHTIVQAINDLFDEPTAELDLKTYEPIFSNTKNSKPSDTHELWLKSKKEDGWVYGEKKDLEKKTHHCMVEFSKLPKEQQLKDFIVLEVVRHYYNAQNV